MTEIKTQANAVDADPNYKVLRKLNVPNRYNQPDGSEVFQAIFLDLETTGLETESCKVIEIAMVLFEYSKEGLIYEVQKETLLDALNDPKEPISPTVTALTGITDEMVMDQIINSDAVERFARRANVIISHNAWFDRPIAERHWPFFEELNWACSLNDISWQDEGMSVSKLEFLGMKFGFFYDGHRAAEDCLAGIEILSQKLPASGKSAMSVLLENAREPVKRIWAVHADFDSTPKMKARGYKWNNGDDGRPKAWSVDVAESEQIDELIWLKENVFGRDVDLPIESITAARQYSRRAEA